DATGGNAANAAPTLSLFGGPAPDAPPMTEGTVNGLPAIRPDEPGSYMLCTSMTFLETTPQRFAHSQNACTNIVYTGEAQDVSLTIKKAIGSLTGRAMLDPSDGSPAVPLPGVRIGGVG